MMITIIPIDNSIVIDGRPAIVDCSTMNSIIHAVTWDGEQGEIQYKTIAGKREPNNAIANMHEFQLVIDAAKAYIAHEDALSAQYLAERKARAAHEELEKAAAAVNPLQAHLEKTMKEKLEAIHVTAANIKADIENQIKDGKITTTEEIDSTFS